MAKREKNDSGFTRRDLLSGSTKVAALAGLGGAAAATGVATLAEKGGVGIKSAKAAEAAAVAPGDLDEYYGFWSSGQTGEVRIMGVP